MPAICSCNKLFHVHPLLCWETSTWRKSYKKSLFPWFKAIVTVAGFQVSAPMKCLNICSSAFETRHSTDIDLAYGLQVSIHLLITLKWHPYVSHTVCWQEIRLFFFFFKKADSNVNSSQRDLGKTAKLPLEQ